MARAKKPESLVLVTSDHHLGKKTRSYDRGVYERRMENVLDRVRDIREYLVGYEFDELVVGYLGDVVDGQDIFPTQPYHQDIPDAVDQAELWSDINAALIEELAECYDTSDIRIEAVCGNHGRTGKRTKESSSFDRVAYNQLRDKLGGQVQVNVGMEDDPFFRPFDVRGHRTLFYHGHELRGCGDKSLQDRAALWHMRKDIGGFEQLHLGHFHDFKALSVNGVEVLLDGTMVTDDPYGRNNLGKGEQNTWRLFGVSERFARTFSYDLHLDAAR